MAAPHRSLLDIEKLCPVVGTYEPNAFLLSLREDDDLSSVHSYGIHCVPHIGVYGSNYSLALPMVLLSLPPSLCFLKQLPPDILNALDIKLDELYTDALIKTASELVQRVLKSAIAQVQPPLAKLRERRLGTFDTSYIDNLIEREHFKNNEEYRLKSESISSDDFEEEDNRYVENTVIEMEAVPMDYEDILRYTAKKLVRKVIRLACQRWESLDRRSSIELDYLVARTKRIKIDSPSPSPSPSVPTPPQSPNQSHTLIPKQDLNEDNNLGSWSQSGDSGIHLVPSDLLSPNPSGLFSPGISFGSEDDLLSQKLGKKRQRSGSHDATSLKDLETFHDKYRQHSCPEPVIGLKNQQESNSTESSPLLTVSGSLTSFGRERRSITDLIANMRKMSIMEVEDEDEEDEDEEGDYLVLEAVTKPLSINEEIVENKQVKFSSRKMPSFQTISSPILEDTETDACTEGPMPIPLIHPDFHVIPKLDYYVIIHSHPPPGLCQKFLCNNMNEINLLFHCWLYKEIPVDPTLSVSEQVCMGLFEPEGVFPIHLDLQDGGVPFYYLESRTVCIHNCCFSPENAQLQLQEGVTWNHSFFSAASYGDRKVLAFHIVPVSKEVEQSISYQLNQCGNTLRELLNSLSILCPNLSQKLHYLLWPLVNN